jgi:aminopeptidase N
MLMKAVLPCLLIFFTFLSSTSGQSGWPVCKELSLIVDLESRMRKPLLDFRSVEATGNYDLKYHRLEWTIDPEVRYIEGKVTSYFVPKEEDFQQIHFELSDSLSVSQVSYRGQALPFVQLDNDLLQIELPEALPMGRLDSLTIIYKGVPPQNGFGSFVQGAHGDEDTPVIWTLSEPYGAKDWWPCKQDLNDKIDSIDVLVRTPAPYRVASNGVLVSEVAEGEEKIYHWRHRYPIPAYLIAVGVTNYAVFSDFVPLENSDSIEVLNYVYPEHEEPIRALTSRTVAVMQLFNKLFGLYPFAGEKYGHAQFGFRGGMEHQTMSFLGVWSFFVQAHELAHQWFGDKVTCGSWEDIWLNEGFATYLEGLTYENGLGNTEWNNWLEGKIAHVTSQTGGSVWVSDTTSVGRIFSGRLSYSKGAMVLHMLRWKLGDETFFQAIRNYLDDPRLAYGYARTRDLKAHLEAQSGQDLSEFFKDWFYGEGYPSYVIHWARQQDQHYQVQIIQNTSHPSVDFFEKPVPILFRGAEQERLLVFDHRFSGQVFDMELPFTPEEVIFDPDHWIVSRDNVVEDQLVSTKEIEELQQRLRLYPNPARDRIMVSFEDWPEIPWRIELLNMQGQLIRTYEPSGTQVKINIASLPRGEYVMKIHTKAGMLARNFLKDG